MREYNVIPVNIWDDFHEDGDVPDGEIQETYAYIEDTNIPLDIQEAVLSMLLTVMKEQVVLRNVDMFLEFHDSRSKYSDEIVARAIANYGEKFFYKRWQIKFKNITHEILWELLVEILSKMDIKHDGIPVVIYSES